MSAEANRATIERLYTAFAARQPAVMAACYRPDATFSDPAFPGLVGPQVGAMWSMLLSREAKVWELVHSDVTADERTGSASWTATYLYGGKRRVVNRIKSKFTFGDDGRIATEVDDFDFHAWTSQALGWTGVLLGWTGFFQRQVQAKARGQLDAYIAKHPAAAASSSS